MLHTSTSVLNPNLFQGGKMKVVHAIPARSRQILSTVPLCPFLIVFGTCFGVMEIAQTERVPYSKPLHLAS